MKNYQLLFRILFSLFVLTWAISVTIPVRAADPVTTWNSSGPWDQPKLGSKRIVLQSINQEVDSNERATASWFAHGDVLDKDWFLAIGVVEPASDGDQVL